MQLSAGRVEQIVGTVVVTFLLIGCFTILRPFLVPILWAMILALATRPAYLRLLGLVGGRAGLAASLMSLLLVLALLVPVLVLGGSVAEQAVGFVGTARAALESGLPPLPDWLAGLPLVGERLQAVWGDLSVHGLQAVDWSRFAKPARDWALGVGGAVGRGTVDLVLALFTLFFFYRDGDKVARALKSAGDRIGGEGSRRLIGVAEATLKGVIYGIIGAALAQGLAAAFGLWLAGVPAAVFLGVVTFFVSLLPGGPMLVWVPAAIWLFHGGQVGWGIFLVVWGLVVIGSIDNIIRPYFIAKGSSLPLLLTVLGVFGGLLAFGFLGIFIGPTLLAVGYTMLREWMRLDVVLGPAPEAAADGGGDGKSTPP